MDRVKQIIDFKKISPRTFEKENGLSNGYIGTQFRRKADLGRGSFNKNIRK